MGLVLGFGGLGLGVGLVLGCSACWGIPGLLLAFLDNTHSEEERGREKRVVKRGRGKRRSREGGGGQEAKESRKEAWRKVHLCVCAIGCGVCDVWSRLVQVEKCSRCVLVLGAVASVVTVNNCDSLTIITVCRSLHIRCVL